MASDYKYSLFVRNEGSKYYRRWLTDVPYEKAIEVQRVLCDRSSHYGRFTSDDIAEVFITRNPDRDFFKTGVMYYRPSRREYEFRQRHQIREI